ncbi:hypothetical protein [Kineococcus rhizosphaerae]|uniref:Uncharacterized protein n=1 Tax=Kineococcus rhizosphaerae TaxID=559628 RepID=A0A2T0QRB3_9ACTN|nr:hypothetical protein [Kineococcus rhizosphaerae]PRY07258.1 hypothetical protein CLV37_1303 [Kineococcus rhizosphaerae]
MNTVAEPQVDRRRRPVNPSPDRVSLRAQAEREVQDVMAQLQDKSEEEQLIEIGRLTNEAFDLEKTTMQRAVAAAFSSEFYDGSRFNLAPLLGVTTTSWAERRRRALQVPEPRWLRNASRDEIAARAQEMGFPHLPEEEERLVELGVAAVAAQEKKAALTEQRNAMVRRMYTASYTNPQGRTQPQLAKLAGISDRLVWQIINPLSQRRAAKKAAQSAVRPSAEVAGGDER